MKPSQVCTLMDAEIHQIKQIDLVNVIQKLRVEPREEFRNWNYGKPGEQFPCWIVVEHFQTNTAIAYCEQGFGDSWGSLFILGPDLSMGMDSCWFATLEDALRNSECWDGENPIGYEVL